MDSKPKAGVADPSQTLGDLLYSKRTNAPIPEAEWVALVRSIAAQDPRALRSLYERSHRLVFTLALRISGSRELAEEIVIDVFHDVWSHAGKYDPANGSVVGWIMNQARSRAIDRVRFEQRQKRQPRPDQPVDAPEPVPTPQDAVDAKLQRRSLERALTSLTPDERETVETAFFSELTYSETAERLGQPLGTVKTRIRSALAKLREILGGEGGGS